MKGYDEEIKEQLGVSQVLLLIIASPTLTSTREVAICVRPSILLCKTVRRSMRTCD